MGGRGEESLIQPGVDGYDALETFTAMIARPAWMADAACADLPLAMSVPDKGAPTDSAKAYYGCRHLRPASAKTTRAPSSALTRQRKASRKLAANAASATT